MQTAVLPEASTPFVMEPVNLFAKQVRAKALQVLGCALTAAVLASLAAEKSYVGLRVSWPNVAG